MRIGYFVGGIVRRGDDGCGNKTLMDADATAAAPLVIVGTSCRLPAAASLSSMALDEIERNLCGRSVTRSSRPRRLLVCPH